MFKKENQQDLLDIIGSAASSDYYRWTAASYLGDFGSKTTRKTVDALIGLLEDGNQNIRSNAADSLGNIAMVNSLKQYVIEQALQPLLHLLKNGDSLGAASAARVVGEIGGPIVVEDLIQALGARKKWWQIRKNAAVALGLIGDSRAVASLITALKDPDSPDIRLGAAESLAKLGDVSALKHLREMEDEDNINVRIAVESAIRILETG